MPGLSDSGVAGLRKARRWLARRRTKLARRPRAGAFSDMTGAAPPPDDRVEAMPGHPTEFAKDYPP